MPRTTRPTAPRKLEYRGRYVIQRDREREARIALIRYTLTVAGLFICGALGLFVSATIADAAHSIPAFASPANFIGCIAAYTASLLLLLSSAGIILLAPIVLHPSRD